GAAAPSLSLALPEQTDPSIQQLSSQYPRYAQLCSRAAVKASEAGFAEVEAMDVVRYSGEDKEGRAVFMFLPGNLSEEIDLELVSMYALWLMHDTVVRQGKPYTAVWICNNLLDSRLSFWWFRRTYRMLPHSYHKQMRCLCMVHPSMQVRIILFMLSFVIRNSLWNKLFYAERIEFLDEVC
ncbi:MAG: hypothetical protein SGPRY_001895, partial [Prymnesium sp.]